jgi:hypothetical protein
MAKSEVSSYGKKIHECRMVPTVITLVAPDEARQRAEGRRLRDIKRVAVARICTEMAAQQGCVTAAELAVMLKTTPTTIGKYIAEWQTANGKLLPRRGTMHDMGPTLTRKKDICRLVFLEGKTVTETMRITKHSEPSTATSPTSDKSSPARPTTAPSRTPPSPQN